MIAHPVICHVMADWQSWRVQFMNSAINEVYGSLLMETRPHVIRDDEDNERCIAFFETLLSKGHLSPEE
jgi:hypothetical protein